MNTFGLPKVPRHNMEFLMPQHEKSHVAVWDLPRCNVESPLTASSYVVFTSRREMSHYSLIILMPQHENGHAIACGGFGFCISPGHFTL